MSHDPPIPKSQEQIDRERAAYRKAARDALHGNGEPWFTDPNAAPAPAPVGNLGPTTSSAEATYPTIEQEIEAELRRIQAEHGYCPSPWGLMPNIPGRNNEPDSSCLAPRLAGDPISSPERKDASELKLEGRILFVIWASPEED